MSIYGITGVHVNELGRIVRARLQQIDGASNTWIGQPNEVEAHQVANQIATGDIIYSIFIVAGGIVHGPKFRLVVYPHGSDGIELEEDIEGRQVQDLVLF